MGFFSKKEDRLYSLEEALKLLKMPKYAKYTTVPIGNGFKIVPETQFVVHSDMIETRGFQKRRGKFVDELSKQGIYGNINTELNYNNYQSAKRYQNQNNINLGR